MSDLYDSEIISGLPKRSSGELDPFLRCLGNNLNERTAFYKYFIWGNLGRPIYLNKYYPKILTMIIKHFRENTLFIVSEDSNSNNINDLKKKWNDITVKTLGDKNKFQMLPPLNRLSDENHQIKIRGNNYISLYYCIIPINLEFQIADINNITSNLNIQKDIQNNHHKYLEEVSKILNLSIEDLIKSSVDLLLTKDWLRKIKNLMENF